MSYTVTLVWSEFYKHLNTKEWYRDMQDKLAVSAFGNNLIRLPMLDNILETYKPSDFKDLSPVDLLRIDTNYITRNDIKINNALVEDNLIFNTFAEKVLNYYGVTGEDIIKMYWYFISLYDSSAENLSMGSGDFVAYKNLLDKERKVMGLAVDVKRDRPHMNKEMFDMTITSIFFGGIANRTKEEWTWKNDWWAFIDVEKALTKYPFLDGQANKNFVESTKLKGYNKNQGLALNMIIDINKSGIGIQKIKNYVGGKGDSSIMFMNWMETLNSQTFK